MGLYLSGLYATLDVDWFQKNKMKKSGFANVSNKLKNSRTASEENILNLDGKGLQNMTNLPNSHSISSLNLDNNSITKIEKLEAFPKLSSLSMINNQLLRMNGVNFAKNLRSVNLSNNGIVSMEGLCWLVHLEHLDLSRNNIKHIQNISYCVKLKHMDLSENSITDITDLRSLVQLKVLLLHSNTITTLERAQDNLPQQLETLSLSGNGISDLNEVRYMSSFTNLKHFSILKNPCVMKTMSLPEFEFRPFISYCLPSLLTLDHSIITDSERRDAERLRKDKNLQLFTFGDHLQLVLYLSKTCSMNEGTRELSEDQTSVQSSNKSHLDLSENIHGNESDSGSTEGDSDLDTLHSESRFLPVYSPMKKSPGIDHRKYQSWENAAPNNEDGSPTVSDVLPIMTEEEASKLIDLAATILQSHIRGFLVRRRFHFKVFKMRHTAASKIQACWRGYYYRNYSYQGLNFKNKVRIMRLQKYISISCLMMKKAEKDYENEKEQMLEIIALLYEKFTQLSEKVEKLESSTNKQVGTETNLDPVFMPHPRLSRNIEHRRNLDNMNEESDCKFLKVSSSQDDNCLEKTAQICQNTVDEALLVNRDNNNVSDVQMESCFGHVVDMGETDLVRKVQEEKEEMKDDFHRPELKHHFLTTEDNSDTEVDASGCFKDVIEVREGVDEDSEIRKVSEKVNDKLPSDIHDDTHEENIMTSEVNDSRLFNTADVCELLDIYQDREKVPETFSNNETPDENMEECKTSDVIEKADTGGVLNVEECQEEISEVEFDEKHSGCESDHDLDIDTRVVYDGKNNKNELTIIQDKQAVLTDVTDHVSSEVEEVTSSDIVESSDTAESGGTDLQVDARTLDKEVHCETSRLSDNENTEELDEVLEVHVNEELERSLKNSLIFVESSSQVTATATDSAEEDIVYEIVEHFPLDMETMTGVKNTKDSVVANVKSDKKIDDRSISSVELGDVNVGHKNLDEEGLKEKSDLADVLEEAEKEINKNEERVVMGEVSLSNVLKGTKIKTENAEVLKGVERQTNNVKDSQPNTTIMVDNTSDPDAVNADGQVILSGILVEAKAISEKDECETMKEFSSSSVVLEGITKIEVEDFEKETENTCDEFSQAREINDVVDKERTEIEEPTDLKSNQTNIDAEVEDEKRVRKVSPKLRTRASSLLSALKDEISGTSSTDDQVEEASTYCADESQEIAEVDELKQRQDLAW